MSERMARSGASKGNFYHPFLPPAGLLPPGGHRRNPQSISISAIFLGGNGVLLANRRLQPLGHVSVRSKYENYHCKSMPSDSLRDDSAVLDETQKTHQTRTETVRFTTHFTTRFTTQESAP